MHTQSCSICKTEFELHFRYQREERIEQLGPGQSRISVEHYCSQRCLEASHRERVDGTVACDACACKFRVELATHVLFTGGRRHYACSRLCRSRILEGARTIRLGELRTPEALAHDAVAEALVGAVVEPVPGPVVTMLAADQNPHSTLHPANDAESSTPPPASLYTPGGAPRVLAVFNHKGGTGKTTTAVTIAAGLAARGKRVLLVDTDGQGNVAISLALKPERTLYHVIVMGIPVHDAVIPARPMIDVLPSNETLAAAELYLAGRRNRDRILAQRLASARHDYDYVILDCSPSLSLMNQNALVTADAVLCPVACDYLSLVGVRQVLRTVRHVNKLLGHPVKFWGVLPTMFDSRARICHEALGTLREHFDTRCLDPVHVAIKVKEAPSQGKTLLEYAPLANATADYLKVVDRLLREAQIDANQTYHAEAGGVG
jgi:chromosome partitioning protein